MGFLVSYPFIQDPKTHTQTISRKETFHSFMKYFTCLPNRKIDRYLIGKANDFLSHEDLKLVINKQSTEFMRPIKR